MQIKNRKQAANMLIEHIAGGRYILDLVEKEERDIKFIAVAFFKSNRAECIRMMINTSIRVYNDLLQQGYEHDREFKESLQLVCDELLGDSVEFETERKCGSAIDSED